MRLYFDTSIIVTLTLQEARWSDLTGWISDRMPSPFYSDFGWGEYVSAVGLKVRRGDLTPAEGREVVSAIDDYLQSWRRLAVSTRDLDAAAEMTKEFDLGLRFPDAIHIAIARRAGMPLVSSDHRQVAAARHFGLEAFNPYSE